MEKEFVKSVAQLMLEGVPLSPAELKELLLRHLLSSPDDAMGGGVTTSLMEAYTEMSNRKGVHLDILTPSEVVELLRKSYEEGYRYLGKSPPPDLIWPRVLPRGYVYPKDIVVQFGNALGYMTAQSVEKSPG